MRIPQSLRWLTLSFSRSPCDGNSKRSWLITHSSRRCFSSGERMRLWSSLLPVAPSPLHAASLDSMTVGWQLCGEGRWLERELLSGLGCGGEAWSWCIVIRAFRRMSRALHCSSDNKPKIMIIITIIIIIIMVIIMMIIIIIIIVMIMIMIMIIIIMIIMIIIIIIIIIIILIIMIIILIIIIIIITIIITIIASEARKAVGLSRSLAIRQLSVCVYECIWRHYHYKKYIHGPRKLSPSHVRDNNIVQRARQRADHFRSGGIFSRLSNDRFHWSTMT